MSPRCHFPNGPVVHLSPLKTPRRLEMSRHIRFLPAGTMENPVPMVGQVAVDFVVREDDGHIGSRMISAWQGHPSESGCGLDHRRESGSAGRLDGF